jgi:hypothetical protein
MGWPGTAATAAGSPPRRPSREARRAISPATSPIPTRWCAATPCAPPRAWASATTPWRWPLRTRPQPSAGSCCPPSSPAAAPPSPTSSSTATAPPGATPRRPGCCPAAAPNASPRSCPSSSPPSPPGTRCCAATPTPCWTRRNANWPGCPRRCAAAGGSGTPAAWPWPPSTARTASLACWSATTPARCPGRCGSG